MTRKPALWCSGFIAPLVTLAVVVLPFLVAHLLAVPSGRIPSLHPVCADPNTPPDSPLRLQNTYDGLIWFVQVSDVHLSQFKPDRLTRFTRFTSTTIPALQPRLVLFTGDITDANRYLSFGPRGQLVEEWEMYHTALRGAGSLLDPSVPHSTSPNSLLWLDIRGNHDAFNVPSPTSPSNFFASYRRSPSPPEGIAGHYDYTFSTRLSTYRLLAIDAVMENAPNRHFFGELSTSDLTALQSLIEQSSSSSSSSSSSPSSPQPTLTLAFGHYPCNTIEPRDDLPASASHPTDLPSLLASSNTVAYLSGHLHRFLHIGSTLYGRHTGPNGVLELELPDFKVHSRYRVLALDGDLLSFVDATLDEWPVVLVTNPKDSRFLSSNEPFCRIQSSSSVRVLAFAAPGDVVASVTIAVDGDMPRPATPTRGDVGDLEPSPAWDTLESDERVQPLWTMAWDPQGLASGSHTLTVTVTTDSGASSVTRQEFSVDGTIGKFQWFEQHFLTTSFGTFLRWVVGLLVCVVWVAMLVVPYVFVERLRWEQAETLAIRGGQEEDDAGAAWVEVQLREGCGDDSLPLWLSSAILPYACLYVVRPSVFKSLMAFVPYVLLGPWFVGSVFNNQYGLQFAWGTWVPGHPLIPHYDSCIYMTMVFTFGVGPIAHLLGVSATRQRLLQLQAGGVVEYPGAGSLFGLLLALLVTLTPLSLAIPGAIFHGLLSTITSPVNLWFGVTATVLAWRAVVTDYLSRHTRASVPEKGE